jgi:hypothetical protein
MTDDLTPLDADDERFVTRLASEAQWHHSDYEYKLLMRCLALARTVPELQVDHAAIRVERKQWRQERRHT